MSDLRIGRYVLGMAQTNSFFVCTDDDNADKQALVIDPADRGDYIFEKLSEKGLKVAGILLTHGHFDHILGANKLRELSGAKIYAYAAEKLVLENTEQNVSSEVGMPCTVKADEYLEDGASVSLADMTFTLIATPGHTMGSACYYFAAQGILFSGDTLFEQSVGRTDLPTGNMGTLTKSIREKLFILPEHVKVYPGHGEPTSIGSEKENNPFV